jgi:hypothetical protein
LRNASPHSGSRREIAHQDTPRARWGIDLVVETGQRGVAIEVRLAQIADALGHPVGSERSPATICLTRSL